MRDQLWINQVARCPKELNKVKKQTCQEATRQKAATAADKSGPSNAQNTITLSSPAKVYVPSTSTPRKKLNDNSKDIKRHTSADKILQTFQSRNLSKDQWNKLADQELTRGVQKYAEDILKSTDMGGEENQKRSTRIL